MKNFFKKLLGKSAKPEQQPEEYGVEEYEADYELKSAGLERVLGKMHGMVGHAIIPFSVGGAVDMYYFPNHIPGTGFATMELLEPDGSGPLPNKLGTYELVAFTKHPINSSNDSQTAFNLVERQVCGIFTTIGFFSREAVLNPMETCEIPNGEGKENTCLVFDLYEPEGKKFIIGERKHHLLLCVQVHKSEMEFGRVNGAGVLFEKLKEAGYYPYSDVDREAVV
jgi:hypothetical protein